MTKEKDKMDERTYGHELDLVLLLSDGNYYSTTDMADRLGITRRHVYNYLDALRSKGFMFEHKGHNYALNMSSPFFDSLRSMSMLTSDEASYICRLLDGLTPTSSMALTICNKLKRRYSLPDITDDKLLRRISGIANKLQDAIAQKYTVKLNHYSSPHSHTVSDRIVEPFLMLNDRQDVICYELNSGTCKTFKLARIGSVDILSVKWTFEKLHQNPYTDIFGFTGNERHSVSLRLGQLSHNLLLEEYPAARQLVVPDGKDHWRIDLICVSLLGVTRFVIGLYDDIKIFGNKEFKEHVKNKIQSMI